MPHSSAQVDRRFTATRRDPFIIHIIGCLYTCIFLCMVFIYDYDLFVFVGWLRNCPRHGTTQGKDGHKAIYVRYEHRRKSETASKRGNKKSPHDLMGH